MIRLAKVENGYATLDGKWTLEPVTMGDGPRSKGRREWRVTSEDHAIGLGGHHTKTVDTMWRARDLIAEYANKDV